MHKPWSLTRQQANKQQGHPSSTCPFIFMQFTDQNNGRTASSAFPLARKGNYIINMTNVKYMTTQSSKVPTKCPTVYFPLCDRISQSNMYNGSTPDIPVSLLCMMHPYSGVSTNLKSSDYVIGLLKQKPSLFVIRPFETNFYSPMYFIVVTNQSQRLLI